MPSPGDQSYDPLSASTAVSTFGVDARGAVLWSTGVSGLAPAPVPYFAGLHASSRTLYMIERSRASDFTTLLRALKLPSPSPSTATLINVGAIVGGVLGGIALATASYFVLANRAALFGKASTESQPLVPSGVLSQRQVSTPAWG